MFVLILSGTSLFPYTLVYGLSRGRYPDSGVFMFLSRVFSFNFLATNLTIAAELEDLPVSWLMQPCVDVVSSVSVRDGCCMCLVEV